MGELDGRILIPNITATKTFVIATDYRSTYDKNDELPNRGFRGIPHTGKPSHLWLT